MSRKNTMLRKMKLLQLTEKQVAQHVMLSENALHSWMSGNKELPYVIMWNICDLLSLDPEEILRK